MLGAAGRAIGGGVGGVQDALSLAVGALLSRQPTRNFAFSSSSSLSSSSSSSSFPSSSSFVSSPVYFNTLPSGWGSSALFVSELEEWESIFLEEDEEDGVVGTEEVGSLSGLNSGPNTSRNEAEYALSSLQGVIVPLGRVEEGLLGVEFPLGFQDKEIIHEEVDDGESTSTASSVETELDWIEPTLQVCYPRASHSEGYDRVLTAFRLLQTDPTVQRMVVSLASDKAVWDAVTKNDAVRDFRESFYADNNHHPDIQGAGNPTTAMNILKWLFKKAKERIIKLIDRVVDILSAIFQPSEKGNEWGDVDAFEGIIRSSFMISLIVILVVVVVVVTHGDHYS